MKIEQRLYIGGDWEVFTPAKTKGFSPQLILYFGAPQFFEKDKTYRQIQGFYPDAQHIIGCTEPSMKRNTTA